MVNPWALDHMGGASKVIKNETPVVGHRADQMLLSSLS